MAKLAPTGAALVYSTYVGRSGTAAGTTVALDAAGGAYVVGSSSTTDWITTTGALQPAYGGGYQDASVFRLSPAGDALAYATCILLAANIAASCCNIGRLSPPTPTLVLGGIAQRRLQLLDRGQVAAQVCRQRLRELK